MGLAEQVLGRVAAAHPEMAAALTRCATGDDQPGASSLPQRVEAITLEQFLMARMYLAVDDALPSSERRSGAWPRPGGVVAAAPAASERI